MRDIGVLVLIGEPAGVLFEGGRSEPHSMAAASA